MSLIQIQIGHSVCLRVCFLHVEMKNGLLLAADPLSGLQTSCLCLNHLVNSVYTITLFLDYENLLLSKALCCCIPSDKSQAISVM